MVTRARAIALMGALLVACQGDEEAIEFVEPGVTGDWDDCIDWELLPICGDPVPELAQLDLTVQSYMVGARETTASRSTQTLCFVSPASRSL